MQNWIVIFCLANAVLLASSSAESVELLEIDVEGAPLISYQAEPMKNPKGGEGFKGSDFIHPLKTPSGFTITELQPADHLHHFGLWWPWKYVSKEGQKVLFWELQRGKGRVEARGGEKSGNGFTATSVYTVHAPNGKTEEWISEKVKASVSELIDSPARGYFLDIEIDQSVLGEQSLEIVKYRYSGFSLRSTFEWNRNNSTMITSEGREHPESNLTRARWVLLQGPNDTEGRAGVLLMSHPANRNHPEHLHTWDNWKPGPRHDSVFVNFNPVQNEPFTMRPGEVYVRRYRLFVFDGAIDTDKAERLWKDWAATAGKDSLLKDE